MTATIKRQEPQAFCCERPDTWRDKLRRLLFPYRHCFAPEAPAEWKDCITIHTTAVISWADRLRLLLTGRMEVTTRTVTEEKIGANITASEFSVLPPKFLAAICILLLLCSTASAQDLVWKQGDKTVGAFVYGATSPAERGQMIRNTFQLIGPQLTKADTLVCKGEADFGKDTEVYLPNCNYVGEGAKWITRVMIDGDGKNKPSATPGFVVGEYARFENFNFYGECWNPSEDGGILGWRDTLKTETVRADYVIPPVGELILVNTKIDGRKVDWPLYFWTSGVKSRKVTATGGEIWTARIGATFGYSGATPQQSSLFDGVKFYLDANGSKSLGESSAYSDDRGAVLAAVVVREGTHVMRNCTVEAIGLNAQFDPGYKPPRYGCNRIAALLTDHFSTDPQKCDITIENCKVLKLVPGLSTVWNDIDVRHADKLKISVDAEAVKAAQVSGTKAVKEATAKAQADVVAARGGSNPDGSFRQWAKP